MALWSPATTESHSYTWSPPQQQQPTTRHRSTTSSSSIGASYSQPSNKIKYQGKRISQIVKLKPECYAEYKKCHAKVWPEVLKQIKACNIEDYAIFYDDNSHILFASFKYMGYDYAGDMERMRENEKVKEWWRMTDKMQESLVSGAKSSEDGEPGWWKGLEEVFYAP